jgi:hypothetical protein
MVKKPNVVDFLHSLIIWELLADFPPDVLLLSVS